MSYVLDRHGCRAISVTQAPPSGGVAGPRCLTLEMRETEIAALIRKGLLHPDSEHDGKAVRTARYTILDRHLGVGM